MGKLERCPRCGKDVAAVAEDGIYFYVECREADGGCGARGGRSHILSRAVDKWNFRKPDLVIGQRVWVIKKLGNGVKRYTVKEDVLRELGYTDRMELAGRVRGAGGRIGVVIFRTPEEAKAKADELNGEDGQEGLPI